MALKDWKKSDRTNERYKQWNSKKKYEGLPDVVTVENPPGRWEVHISRLNEEISKEFKTRATAIAFAKNYMRKH